jgi:hypothetical protein
MKIYKSPNLCCEETTNNETVVEDVIYNGGIGFEFPAEYKGGIEKILCF